MHILKISTLVISLLNTKFMPCFFPCKDKKLAQFLGDWAKDIHCHNGHKEYNLLIIRYFLTSHAAITHAVL